MTTKLIAYTEPDGSLAICNPSAGWRNVTIRLQGVVETVRVEQLERLRALGAAFEIVALEDESDWLERVRAKDVPPGATNVQIIEESARPADRTFRDALTMRRKQVLHDITRARAVTQRHMRRAKLAAERKRQQPAAEPIDPRVAAAKTIEQLAALSGEE